MMFSPLIMTVYEVGILLRSIMLPSNRVRLNLIFDNELPDIGENMIFDGSTEKGNPLLNLSVENENIISVAFPSTIEPFTSVLCT